jgi:hypothetical protein
MAFFDEGALWHEVLAPGDDSGSEAEHADAEGQCLPLGGGVDPVSDDESDEATHPHQHGQDGQPLHPLWVLGQGLKVWVVEGGRWPSGSRVVVAHVRSPIQKHTSISIPTPRRSPTKPSPTGPIPPSPAPPELFGCWSTPVT